MDHRHNPSEHTLHTHPDPAGLAELLDLDATILSGYLSELTQWVRQLSPPARVRRILDLGAGTGTGTIALAHRFSNAHVVALDRSEHMLHTIRSKALTSGLADRISTIEANATAPWPPITPVDLIWAASSLHEMPDAKAVIASAHASLTPGGLFVVVEMDAPPRLLPHDVGVGSPGLEERIHALLAGSFNSGNSHPAWGEPLQRAGFELLATRTFTIDLPAGSTHAPHPSTIGRYARVYLQQVRRGLAGRLSGEDAATLDILLADSGQHCLLERTDLRVSGSRTVWVGRR
jgi:SAM-dependent methyltransferase